MDSDDGDLVLCTEINKTIFKIIWTIDNPKNIPDSIKSPNFSFAPEYNKDWYLTVKYSEDDSICISLSRDSEDSQPLRVETRTCVIDANEERLSVTVKRMFQNKDTHVICNHLCTFPDELSQDERESSSDERESSSDERESSSDKLVLNLEFNFVLYGLEIVTETAYYDEEGVDVDDENEKDIGDVIKTENLDDVRIHVGKEVFTAHKFILRLRAPKFVDKHLKYGTKTTLHNMEPGIFKSLIGYIYKNEVPSIELQQHSKELYEIACRYDMKRLQKLCSEELRKGLKLGNVLEYLKMAQNYKEYYLERAAYVFIKKNSDEMCRRTDWEALIKSSPHLESEILHSSAY